jgi:hypothetical protein
VQTSEPIRSQPLALGASQTLPMQPFGLEIPGEMGMVFDSRAAQLRQMDGSWKIVVGNQVLKDFGNRQLEARDALKAIQFYRFNEQHFVGRGENRMEYYLVSGQPPRGRMLGQQATSLSPEYLTVRKLDDGWWLTQWDARLVRFTSKEDAQAGLELIRKYRFDTLCTIGRPVPSMIYFTRTR